MEIIQFITVNADHELQHIVDKGCQSCALIPQQMEYFRNFVLGFEADIYGSPFIGTLYGTEKRLLEIGQQNLFFAGILICQEFFRNRPVLSRLPEPAVRFLSQRSYCVSSVQHHPVSDHFVRHPCRQLLSTEHLPECVFVHFNPFAGGMFECVFVFFERIFPL